jgi:peptide methionine sulfoxide reductase msrA/msrB
MKIIFAAGCFWGVEKYFANLDGVSKTLVGYTAGEYKNPSYESVLQYRDSVEIVNHTEAVEVIYDEKIISTEQLIKSFWQMHNPTQGNRQGNDIGTNYRSGIYWTESEQRDIAFETKEKYQLLLTQAGFAKITTEIQPLEKFYNAEDYHQKYLTNNPSGYCPNHSTGVKFL